jgi:hypothetical protein
MQFKAWFKSPTKPDETNILKNIMVILPHVAKSFASAGSINT